MTNAVDSLNVENIVEGSRCATALASHAGIPEPLLLRFEEGGGSLPPGGSSWRKEYQGGSGSRPEIDASRGFLEAPYLHTKYCLEQIHGASRLSLIRSPAKVFPDYHAAWGHQW
jgi:hypothetical protein